eukprot:Amastigsp_a192632_17.p4 type:complete len:120 gc:universal Amastigsp_a192632_17:950-591(-)
MRLGPLWASRAQAALARFRLHQLRRGWTRQTASRPSSSRLRVNKGTIFVQLCARALDRIAAERGQAKWLPFHCTNVYIAETELTVPTTRALSSPIETVTPATWAPPLNEFVIMSRLSNS